MLEQYRLQTRQKQDAANTRDAQDARRITQRKNALNSTEDGTDDTLQPLVISFHFIGSPHIEKTDKRAWGRVFQSPIRLIQD